MLLNVHAKNHENFIKTMFFEKKFFLTNTSTGDSGGFVELDR